MQSLPLGQERREKGEEKPEKLLEVWLEEEQMMVGSPIGSQLESLPQSDDEVDMEDEDEKDEEAEDDLTMPATPNTSQESLPPGQGTPFNAVVPASPGRNLLTNQLNWTQIGSRIARHMY